MTVLTVEEFLLNNLKKFIFHENSDEQNVLTEFRNALRNTDALLFGQASQHPELSGMGTTLALAFAVNWKLYLAHAGDSRCYLYSNGILQQVTRDHTEVAELVSHGVLTPEEAQMSRYRNIVTNVLDGGIQVLQLNFISLN